MMDRSNEAFFEEGRLISRYLIEREPSVEILGRYAEAHRLLLPEAHPRSDWAVVDHVRRHPASLPFLDAAAAWFCPKSLLRKKILLMLALLEATPEHIDFFSQEPVSFFFFMRRAVRHGLSSGLKWMVGAFLYAVVIAREKCTT